EGEECLVEPGRQRPAADGGGRLGDCPHLRQPDVVGGLSVGIEVFELGQGRRRLVRRPLGGQAENPWWCRWHRRGRERPPPAGREWSRGTRRSPHPGGAPRAPPG